MSMTANPVSVIDEDRFTVRRSIHVSAPVEKVWDAVTAPEHISKWFGRVELDGRGAGATGTITFPDYGAVPLRIEAIEPPRSVTFRWSNDDALGAPPAELDEDHSTVFTFTLESAGDGTRLTVVESGFERTSAPLANLRDHQTGWNGELDKLVALFEGAA